MENENEIICASCGCVIEGNVLMVGDDPFCTDCAVRCYECGTVILRDDALVSSDGEFFCDIECANNAEYEMCEDCGEVVPSSCIVVVNEGTRFERLVCEECADGNEYFKCDNCHDYFSRRYFSCVTTHYGDEICEECYEESYGTCDECGEVFPNDELDYSEYRDGYVCDSCRESEERKRGCINRYSYKPSAIYFGLNGRRPVFGDPLTFGFELEVDQGGDQGYCAGEIEQAMGDQVYMKEDGSVTFEIVSHPMTIAYLRSEFDMKTLCSIPPKYEFKSHDAGTCGLHVHVGRKQLGLDTDEQDAVIERICVLMLRHWDNLVRFTRREQSQLRRWASKPDLFSGEEKHICINELHERFESYERDSDRYVALNLCNHDTIEFRVYRGSLKPDTVLASLEFTSNICRYAMEHNLRDVLRSSWEDVALFERYPELDAYLEERGLSGESKLSPNDLPVSHVYEANAGDYVRVRMDNMTFCAELLNDIHEDSPVLLVNIRIPERMKELGLRPGEVTIPVDSIVEIAPPDEVDRENMVFNLHVGSRVIISRDSYYQELGGLSATVVALRKGYQNGYESIGLSIHGYHDGHSLDGVCANLGYPTDSGWWVRTHDIGQVIA